MSCVCAFTRSDTQARCVCQQGDTQGQRAHSAGLCSSHVGKLLTNMVSVEGHFIWCLFEMASKHIGAEPAPQFSPSPQTADPEVGVCWHCGCGQPSVALSAHCQTSGLPSTAEHWDSRSLTCEPHRTPAPTWLGSSSHQICCGLGSPGRPARERPEGPHVGRLWGKPQTHQVRPHSWPCTVLRNMARPGVAVGPELGLCSSGGTVVAVECGKPRRGGPCPVPGCPVHHLSNPMPVCLWHSLSGRGGPQVPCRPGVSTRHLAGLPVGLGPVHSQGGGRRVAGALPSAGGVSTGLWAGSPASASC